MNDNNTIAFIGCGNMALSMVQGLLNNGYPQDKLWATSRRIERINYFRETLAIHATTDNLEAAAKADIIVLAVKPQQMQAVAQQLAEANILSVKQPLIISVAVGINTTHLTKWLAFDGAIVRSMPNTPALIGAGATGLYANQQVSAEQKALAESLHQAIGMVVWVEQEAQLDTVAALSGSGPAYIFYIIEALQTAGEKLGLSAEQAKLLALQTSYGASRLALESEESAASLRAKVTSPNGTTEQAIKVFDQHRLTEIFEQAMQAAIEQSVKLNKLFD